uniref:ubiquitinyl hydrolase 1 n=1 Tax=Panagrellus redivivus TaxID=6233 RepID=A0A7E4V283_PANRE
MGANASTQLEKEITADHVLANEHFYGLINFGNTCYCNSVIQALYFCQPFREKILEYRVQTKKTSGQRDNLLTCLADLFMSIANQKRRVGTIAPKRFITKLKKENELFDNFMQQDAHEFFNFLLNAISETLIEDLKRDSARDSINGRREGSSSQSNGPTQSVSDSENGETPKTWIHEIFQGTLTNETRCLNCETVSSKDEDFLDLSVDVQPNVSITYCLRDFSNMETLCGDQKYYCENCCSKQEAQKRMRIKKLPRLLALHLKRFKYMEHLSRETKLSYRVMFPMELRLFNVRDDADDSDRLYDLVAVVVHCGSTPNRGHYLTLVKSHSFWLLFDDDIVDKIEGASLEAYFGLSDCNVQKNSNSAYILFYQARD